MFLRKSFSGSNLILFRTGGDGLDQVLAVLSLPSVANCRSVGCPRPAIDLRQTPHDRMDKCWDKQGQDGVEGFRHPKSAHWLYKNHRRVYRHRCKLGRFTAPRRPRSGVSISIGGHGLTANLNPKGAMATIGLAGSGVSYRTKRRTLSRCIRSSPSVALSIALTM